jgi:anti-anti-sigma factor
MSHAAFIDDDAFFEVASPPIPHNKPIESMEIARNKDVIPPEADIPIDQPLGEDTLVEHAIFEVTPVRATTFPDLKNKEYAKQKTEHTKRIPAIYFPYGAELKEQEFEPIKTDVSQVIPIAESTFQVVQLKAQARSQAENHEWVLLDSNIKNQGDNTMHALKKEHDDRFQEDTSPVINIVRSDDIEKTSLKNDSPGIAVNNDIIHPYLESTGFNPAPESAARQEKIDLSSSSKSEEKQTMKSRIVPSIETASFQASVVEGETSSEERIVVLIGRIDHEQVRELENFLNRVIQKETINLFCDIAGLTSINSSGWGLLVAEMQRLRKRGGSLFLCGLQGTVEQSFKVLELDKLFMTFRTVSEAMRSSSAAQENIRPFPTTKIQNESSADNLSCLSLEEKIQHIIADDPLLGTSGIRKALNDEKFGKIKIGSIKLMSKLRSMGLGTQEERYRFFRSS